MNGMTRQRDFLDEFVARRSAKNPAFGELVDAALERRRLLRALSRERERLGLTQTQVAARIGTSQSAVARLEGGEVDPKLSTVGRYAAAVGRRITWSVQPAGRARGESKKPRPETSAAKSGAKRKRAAVSKAAQG